MPAKVRLPNLYGNLLGAEPPLRGVVHPVLAAETGVRGADPLTRSYRSLIAEIVRPLEE